MKLIASIVESLDIELQIVDSINKQMLQKVKILVRIQTPKKCLFLASNSFVKDGNIWYFWILGVAIVCVKKKLLLL